MNLFSPNGGLYRFMTLLVDMVKISLLWVLCSLPVVTIGPATIAAFYVTMKIIDNEEGYVARTFLKQFRSNLKNGIPLGLLMVVCAEIVNLDFQLAARLEGHPVMPFVFGIVALFVFYLAFVYAFALSARYENTLLKTLKNSYDISVRYFVRTLFLLIMLVVEFVLIFLDLNTVFIGLLIGPAVVVRTIAEVALPIFRELEKEDGAVIVPEE